MNEEYSLVEIDNLLWIEGINSDSKLLVVRIPTDVLKTIIKPQNKISIASKELLSKQEKGALEWLENNYPEKML